MDNSNDIVASRRFTRAGGAAVVLSIEKPKPHPDGWDWTCGVILASSDQRRYEVMGVDSLQALIFALGIAKGLVHDESASAGGLEWIGGADLGMDFELNLERRRSQP